MEEEKIIEEPVEEKTEETAEVEETNVDVLNLEDDFIEVVGDCNEVIEEVEEEVK